MNAWPWHRIHRLLLTAQYGEPQERPTVRSAVVRLLRWSWSLIQQEEVSRGWSWKAALMHQGLALDATEEPE